LTTASAERAIALRSTVPPPSPRPGAWS
jgi:hypothetical protein